MSSRVLSLSAMLLVLLGAGCDGAHETKTSQETLIQDVRHRIQDFESITSSTSPTNNRAIIESRFRLATQQFSLGKQTLAFQLFNKDRTPLDPEQLQLVHEKLVHLLLVRKDMTQFQHLHPEFVDGAWVTDVSFTEPGDYYIYVDVTPLQETPMVFHDSFKVAGTPTYAEPNPNVDRAVRTDGYYVTLETAENTELVTGWNNVRYVVTREGTPPAFDPYLGAYGHVVALKHFDALVFAHTHPLDNAAPKDGSLGFAVEFPTPGRYTLYAQFNLDSTVHTFPITVDVKTRTAAQPEEAHGETH